MILDEIVRAVNANKKFKIKDEFKFIEFNDVSKEGIQPDSPVPDQVEIWVAIQVEYEGTVPDSYKTLNLIIGDWVERHEEKLTEVIHNELKRHFEEHYPGADVSELDNGDSVIWLDQLDYMPRIEGDRKTIIIEVELYMDTEPFNQY